MPRARYTADGGTYRVSGHSFEPGEEREVDKELATYLADHEEFEVVLEKGDAGESSETDEDDNSEDDGEGEDVDGDEFDVDEFLDRNVDPIADDIRAGEADDHLDELGEETDRVTVQDAIGERRAELEA